jgi:hypothetical protein
MCIESTNKVPAIIDGTPNMEKAIQIKTDVEDKKSLFLKVPAGDANEWIRLSIAQLKLAIMHAEQSFTV